MSHRLSMKELDEQFELFLKESVSDDSVDLGVSEKQPSDGGAKKAQVSWWQDDEDGLSGSGKSFRKSLRKSHSIREEDEEPGDTGVRDRGPEPVVLSRDHTETEDLVKVPAVNMTSLGLDTLEEEEEKARFFAQIEAGASSTIDYSKLNRELDSTSHSHVKSGGSEMEALHDAYRQIHVVEDSDDCDHNHHNSTMEGREERLLKSVSPTFPAQHDRQSLQPASTNESDLPTAEELMRPIRIEEDHTRGFSLRPIRSGLQHPKQYHRTSCWSLQIAGPLSLVEELSVRLAQKERELQAVMKDGDEELNALRQQNYVLQSKLRSAEEAYQRRRWAEATDSAPEGTFQQMDKELKEQEALIKGYQQENEKLYLQLKAQQAKSKSNEDAMFSENQRLLSQLTFTRCVQNEAKLNEDVHRLKQENQALEVDLQLLKRERDLAKAQVVSTSGDKTFELRALEETHREEVSALKKKLQWFADNQELLDRDAGRLTAAAAQIHQLKEQVENLKMEVKKSEQQRKARDKSADTKKMQDLQRQVKELEQILRHRNPNSLPALIYAAASAEAAEEADTTKTSAPDKIVALLEHRIQRLEAELESHDEEAKRSLRAMEQRFHGVKLRYEQQISELEQQLEQKQQVEVESSAAGSRPLTSQVQTLEAEEKDLQQMKEIHLEKEKSPHDQVESLQQQLRNRVLVTPTPQLGSGRHQRQAEDAFRVRLERMNHELAAKTRSVQELSRTVERLQRERRNMLSVPDPQAETQSTETQRKPAPARTLSSVTSKETPGGEETFPAAHNEKTYQPTVFAGSHISEVLQENEALTQRLELLQLQAQQEKEARKADAARAEEELRRLLERRAEQLSSLKAEHLQALDRQRAAHALEHSSSKVAEQANQLVAQEIKMKHLQDQLKELQGTREALTVSRTREGALQRQLAKLLSELKEAQEAQSSEVKLLCGLERKIVSMELRHQHREMELTQVIGGSWHLLEAQQPSEVERWKHLAQDKSRELEAFRLELDSILDVLKHLQRQGVVFPPTPTSSSS
uniref:Centrosomal protein of 162 kDa n=1 Tax=Scophthalmus maximus TaxID=52904 RepID=A0A8D3CQU4_SCOMX